MNQKNYSVSNSLYLQYDSFLLLRLTSYSFLDLRRHLSMIVKQAYQTVVDLIKRLTNDFLIYEFGLDYVLIASLHYI